MKKDEKNPNMEQFHPIWVNRWTVFFLLWIVGFHLWASSGLGNVGDLTFEEIKAKFDICNKHFLKYLQVRSFIALAQSQMFTAPLLSTLEETNSNNLYSKGDICLLYILVFSSNESSVSRMIAWREDMQGETSLEECGTICLKAHGQTMNKRLWLLL